jgi:plasmid stabilization system protein ParE
MDGTREAIIHPNYILVYRVEAHQIRIVNVLHTARRYPPE